MRGKKHISKNKIQPDPKYGREDVAKFINYLMRKGKKTIAQKIIYRAFDILKNQFKQDPLKIFSQAIHNVSPSVEVRSRRVGGANYQIPSPVRGPRQFTLASRWIIAAAEGRKGKSMAEKLSQEFFDASQNQGAAIKKKEDIYRMAEANKAFAHFARFTR